MTIAERIRATLIQAFCLSALLALPAVPRAQGILPSTWVYGSITLANSVAYSPDGKLLALGGDGGLQIYSSATNTLLTCIPTEAAEVNSVAFSPDGHTLALGGCLGLYGNGGPVVELWNVTTGAFIRSLSSNSSIVYSVGFSRDGKLLAEGGWYPGAIDIWNVSTGKLVESLATALNTTTSLQFSPDGTTLAAGGYDGNTALETWDVATGKRLNALRSACSEIESVCFSPDGKTLATGGWESSETQSNLGIVEIWDVASGRLRTTPAINSDDVQSVAYSPDGKTLAVSYQQFIDQAYVSLWNAATYTVEVNLQSDPAGLSGRIAFSPSGKSLAVFGNLEVGYTDNSDSQVVTWDLPTGNQSAAFTANPYATASAISFSPDGNGIALGGGTASFGGGPGWVGVWDANTKKLKATFKTAATSGITAVAFSSDGALLADGGGNLYETPVVEVWNIATGSQVISIPAQNMTAIKSMAFSPTANILAVAGGRSDVQIWDVAAPSLVRDIDTGADNGVTSICFSPDGRLLLIAGTTQVGVYQAGILELWDVGSGQLYAELPTNLYLLSNVAFSADGTLFADGGVQYIPNLNKTLAAVELWRHPSDKMVSFLPISPTTYPITSISFTPHGEALFASSNQGVQAFDTEQHSLIGTFDIGPVGQISISPKGGQLAYAMNSTLAVASIPSFGTSPVASVTFSPQRVLGGTASTGTVALSHPAPSEGIDVSLSSASSSVTVTPSIAVPAGATQAEFQFSTAAVDKPTTVAVTAQIGKAKKSGTCTIVPPALSSVSVAPAVTGGNSLTVFVYLTGPAGPSGVTLTIKSSNPALSVPASALVSSGARATWFTATAATVTSQVAVTLTATLGSVSVTGTVMVEPAILGTLSLNPTSVAGGQASTGSVTLTSPAPAGGILIALSSNNSAATVPATVTVPAGQTSVTFTVETKAASDTTSAVIEATLGSQEVAKLLTIT